MRHIVKIILSSSCFAFAVSYANETQEKTQVSSAILENKDSNETAKFMEYSLNSPPVGWNLNKTEMEVYFRRCPVSLFGVISNEDKYEDNFGYGFGFDKYLFSGETFVEKNGDFAKIYNELTFDKEQLKSKSYKTISSKLYDVPDSRDSVFFVQNQSRSFACGSDPYPDPRKECDRFIFGAGNFRIYGHPSAPIASIPVGHVALTSVSFYSRDKGKSISSTFTDSKFEDRPFFIQSCFYKTVN